MTDAERLAFFQEIIPLVKPENMPWKADSWSSPTAWDPIEKAGKRSPASTAQSNTAMCALSPLRSRTDTST